MLKDYHCDGTTLCGAPSCVRRQSKTRSPRVVSWHRYWSKKSRAGGHYISANNVPRYGVDRASTDSTQWSVVDRRSPDIRMSREYRGGLLSLLCATRSEVKRPKKGELVILS